MYIKIVASWRSLLENKLGEGFGEGIGETRLCLQAKGKAQGGRKILKMQSKTGMRPGPRGGRRGCHPSWPDTEEEELLREQRKGKKN